MEDAAAAQRGHASELAAIIRGMSVALLGSVFGGGLGFAFGIVMARLLHQVQFGLLILAVNLLSAASAVTIAGADYAAIRHVAAARTAGGKRGAMIAPLRLVMILNIVVAAVVAVFAKPIAHDLLGQPEFTNVLRAATLTLPLTVLAQMFSACLSGLERAIGEFVRKVVEQGGRIVLGAVVLSLGWGLVGATLSMAVAAAAAVGAVGYTLWRALPRGGKTERSDARVVFAFAWPQAVANIATQLWAIIALVILARSTDARTVALFGAAFAISQLPLLVYNAFTYRFSPAIARLWNQGEVEALDQLLRSVTRWVAMFALPLFAVAIALPAPLLEIYGSRYRPAALALALMTIATLINALAGPVERALVMTGLVKLEMVTNIVATVLIVGAAAILTPKYGLTGAAVSVLLYTVVRNAAKTYLLYARIRMAALSFTLLRPLAAAVIASSLVAAIARFTSLGAHLLGTALLAFVLIAAYVVVLLRVVGISSADRRTLRLALRPSGPTTMSDPTLG